MTRKLAIAAALLGSSLMLMSAPADARWWGHHGGWGYGAAGFAAGALLGSAIASRPYYYDYGYYGPPAYAYAPGRATPLTMRPIVSRVSAPTTRPQVPTWAMTGADTLVRSGIRCRRATK